MTPTDKCDACKYVRYSFDGGSTYCGRRRNGKGPECKFVPAEPKHDAKSASSAAQDTTTL